MAIAHLPTPMLFWVAHGRAVLSIDGEEWSLGSGEALVIARGASVSARTRSTAVPTWLPGAETPMTRRIRIPREWEPIILHRFAAGLGYLRPTEGGRDLPFIAGSGPEARAGDTSEGDRRVPPMPADENLGRLARFLLASLGTQHRLGRLADTVSLSPRTLQRRFREETGMTLSTWLTSARVCASLPLLAADLRIYLIAHRVGFADASAFSRAFRRFMAHTPREARRRLRARAAETGRPDGDDPEPSALPPVFAHLPDDEVTTTAPIPLLPASQTWPRVNGSHVAIWVYRGTADISVGTRQRTLHEGDALVLPASTHHEVRARQDSLVLPLGFRPAGGMPATTEALNVHRFHPESTAAILYGIVSTYTALRPRVSVANTLFDHVALHTVDIERGPPTLRTSSDSTITDLLGYLARNPHAPTALGHWSEQLDVSISELNQAVHSATGLPYRTWRMVSRMTFAREALLRGVPTATVARQTGYAQPSSFSRAFSATFGLSPRRFTAASESDRTTLPAVLMRQRARSADSFGSGPPSAPTPPTRAIP